MKPAPTQTGPLESPWPAGRLGTARLEAAPAFQAGSYGTWTVTYTVGPYGMDDAGGLKLLWPVQSDRGIPQFEDPAAANYVSLDADGAASLIPRWEPRAHIRPWTRGILITVTDGSLAPGDTVTLHLGETAGGGGGWRTQSFAEEASNLKLMVDPFATGLFYDVPGDLSRPVIAAEPVRLVALLRGRPGQAEITLTVRAVDRYGNVAGDYRGHVEVSGPLGEVCAEHAFSASDSGVWTTRIPRIAAEESVVRLKIRDSQGWATMTNPLGLEGPLAGPVLWGDTQGQTGETVGAGTIDDFMSYARDVAQLDFVSHSANDFQVEEEAYKDSLRAAEEYHRPGSFLTFAGFEWSGNTAVGGDQNVLYADPARAPLARSSHALVSSPGGLAEEAPTVADLYELLEERGIEAVCVPHVGGRRVKLTMLDVRYSPVLEIVSVHGWFEWLLLEALREELMVGVLGASDDHSGRPGASYPTSVAFGVRNGLAAVLSAQHTREGVLKALRARHTYATTGERILLSVRSGEHIMGDYWHAESAPEIRVLAAGTAPIEAIEILNGEGVISRWAPDVPADPMRLRISWRGARSRDRLRTKSWDGGLRVYGAQILSAEPWSCDHPSHGVRLESKSTVSWVSGTNGDSDGVEITVDSVPEAMHFSGGGLEADIDLSKLDDQPYELPVEGGVDCAVTVARLPAAQLPLEAEVTFTDLPSSPGFNPYVVKVHQADGHLAWSSPLFVQVP